MTEGNSTDLRSLGETLRAAREAQGRSLEQLSTATRISPRMLEALEADSLDKLGTPVYAKGFVRTVARELHLDERSVVMKLEAQLAAGPSGEAAAGGRGAIWRYEQVKVVRPVAAGRRRPAPWQLALALLLLLLAVLGGVWLGRRGGTQPRADVPMQPATPPGVPAATSASSTPPAPAPNAAAASTAPSTGPLEGAATSPVPPPRAATPTPLTTPAGAAQQEVVVFPQRSGLASIERSGAEPAPARLHFLDLRAKGHVEVVARIDGGEPQRRVLDAGQSWKLSAREFFTLRLSDAAACEVWLDGAQQRSPGASVEFRVPPEPAP